MIFGFVHHRGRPAGVKYIIKNANPGELYKVGNAPRPYYKSLNVYYNKLEDKR